MTPNNGQRPSWLDLGRHASGEAPLPQDRLDPQRLTLIEQERARTPAFDWTILQAAAHRLESLPETPRPKPVVLPWYRRFTLLLPAFAIALALVIFSPEAILNQTKGGPTLDFYLLRDGEVYPGDPAQVYREGDRIQFTYRADGYTSLCLVSMDGNGMITTFYPEKGEVAQPVDPHGSHVLPHSILLDDAPGPEYFIGFFGDYLASEAIDRVQAAWDRGGAGGIQELDEEADIVVLALERE